MMNREFKNQIDCKEIANKIKDEVGQAVYNLGDSPQLATIMIGERVDNAVYLANTKKAIMEIDMFSISSYASESISEEDLLRLVHFYNNSEDVNGISIQLPLPSHIDERAIINAIDPLKDVEGITNENLGKLVVSDEVDVLTPSTSLAILEIIKHSIANYKGKKVMVIGNDIKIGKPLPILLKNEDMAVMSVTFKSKETIKKHIDSFKPDILVSCIGVKNSIHIDMLKDSSIKVFIDCSIIADDENFGIRGDFNKEQYDDLDMTGIKWTSVDEGINLVAPAMITKNLYKAYELQEEAWY